jgi:hypothetical protein
MDRAVFTNLEGFFIGMMKPLIAEAVNEAIRTNAPVQLKPLTNYLKTPEAAKFISKTSNALRVMVCKNQIKSIKKGNSLYFLETDLIEYLESGRKKTVDELKEGFEDILLKTKKG